MRFAQSFFKVSPNESTEHRPFRPIPVFATVGHPCRLLPLTTYLAPYFTVLVLTPRHRARCGSFRNCDFTDSFLSSHTSPPIFIRIITHHITFQESPNVVLVIGSH